MSKQTNDTKNGKMKSVQIWSIVTSLAIIALVAVFLFTGKNSITQLGNAEITSTTKVANLKNVVITKSEITETAKFFSYETDGTNMELLAFKASDGTIRTAFNTCQVCYDSGRGYYVQEGDVLVCQNCGNRYPAERVGIDVNGCNPIPIMDGDRTEDDETITITDDLIVQYKDYFNNWKKS